jgi:hypothetical protein
VLLLRKRGERDDGQRDTNDSAFHDSSPFRLNVRCHLLGAENAPLE